MALCGVYVIINDGCFPLQFLLLEELNLDECTRVCMQINQLHVIHEDG